MARGKYVVGIDLGTTHSAVAFSPKDREAIEVFPVPQLVAPGEAAAMSLLPSTVYLPAVDELPEGATRLPWGAEPETIVGELARRLGAKVPLRLVASAKSWLSHQGADRQAPILPWGAPEGVEKISPVEATAKILTHVREAWDAGHKGQPLRDQQVILTLPASFDEVARELTVAAAREAGLGAFRLLEEPQAAFYDFLSQRGAALGEAIGDARLICVVDVGGGTTDLTLIRVIPNEARPDQPPRLERIAVGDHLMLGGDNMDVTLARHVEAAQGLRLSHAAWTALVHASRVAKETLLAGGGPPTYGLSIPGSGKSLVGGARTFELPKEEAVRILLDGFLPKTGPGETPTKKRMGLTELGLPYASDPAVSRHLNAFLRRHVQAAAEAGAKIHDGLPKPDALLLNGGVFNAPMVVERLSEVLEGWYGEPIPLFSHGSLDLAVARGAAQYGLVRRGLGAKIEGGSPRAYFLGLAAEGGEKRAICVVPRGMEEGASEKIETQTFDLLLGEPVTFPLYASTQDQAVSPGEIVDAKGLDPLPPLHTVLEGEGAGATVPVQIAAALTEIGTLELHLQTVGPASRRWRLEFILRGKAGGGAEVAPIQELPRRFDEAKAVVERAFGSKSQPVEPREIKQLWRSLEAVIGERESWTSAVNRELWGIVFGGAQRRRRSADHERIFFQLAGFCLRPGYGAPLDEWRVAQLWKLFQQGVQYTNEKPNWAAWWVMWRRVAGGLGAGQQRQLFDWMRPWLEPPKGRFPPKPKGPKAEGRDEMVRLLGSLERLDPAQKEEAARWILHHLEGQKGGSYWPLGRLGARQPLYGSAHDVVGPAVAEGWLQKLLPLDWKRVEGAAFAAARIAAKTGDRGRDVDEGLRQEVAKKLEAAGSPASWAQMVREGGELSEQDRVRVFGETLPLGLRISPE